jgi:Fic family protein
MAEEYPIDGGRFAQTLVEQRAMKLPGGLYQLNQIELAYNTNRIEGSQLTAEQTRFIYETRTIDGRASVDDVIETVNHFRVFDLMLDSYRSPLTSGRIREYHRILKTGTSDAEKPWFAVGDWKQIPNTVGGITTVAPEHVELAITELLGDYYTADRVMSFEDICDFHHRFESIHPFQDGNGRIGRIILFEQCLAAGIMPFIVLDEEKDFYYRGLSQYDQEPGYLRDTFRHFQDIYYAKYHEFIPAAGV